MQFSRRYLIPLPAENDPRDIALPARASGGAEKIYLLFTTWLVASFRFMQVRMLDKPTLEMLRMVSAARTRCPIEALFCAACCCRYH
jgi:hypothetical protein